MQKKYIEAHFPTNYVEQDAQLRKEISYTTIFQKMNLPLDYYQMGVSFQYLQNGNAFVISRETANKNTSLTINITYDGETISTTKNLCIVGTSAESLLSSYAKELGYLLNRHEISPDNSIWIGGNEDKTSLYSKYYPYIHTPMAESNHDYVLGVCKNANHQLQTAKISLEEVVDSSTNQFQGYLLHGQSVVSSESNNPYVYIQDGDQYEYIQTKVKNMSFDERLNSFKGYLQNYYFAQENETRTLPDLTVSGVQKVGVANLIYQTWNVSTNQETKQYFDSSSFQVVQSGTQFILEPVGKVLSQTGISYELSAYVFFDEDAFSYTNSENQEIVVDLSTLSLSQLLAIKEELSSKQDKSDFTRFEELLQARIVYTNILIASSGLGGNNEPSFIGAQFETQFQTYNQLLGSTDDFKSELYFMFLFDYQKMVENISSEMIEAVKNSWNTLHGTSITNTDVINAGIDPELNVPYYQKYLSSYLSNYVSMIQTPVNSSASDKMKTHSYKFVVTGNKVPQFDTTVYVIAYITDNSEYGLNEETFVQNKDKVYTQNYSFVIPGVIQNNAEGIVNPYLYQVILDYYNGSYGTNDERKNYLLTSEAKAEVALLDLSLTQCNQILTRKNQTTSVDISNESIDLSGLSYLENTHGFIFDGLKVTNIYGLLPSTTKNNKTTYQLDYHIESLSFNDCKLGDTLILDHGNIPEDMTYFSSLESIYLNNNKITIIPHFYRRLSQLWMNNNDINQISNLTTLSNLQILGIENNHIDSFEDLKSLTKIKTIYLAGNTSLIPNTTYYGTNGGINVPVYVALVDRGVCVYTGLYKANSSKIYYNQNGEVISSLYTIEEKEIDGKKYYVPQKIRFTNNNTSVYTLNHQTTYFDSQGNAIVFYQNGEEVTITDSTEILLSYSTDSISYEIAVALNSIVYFKQIICDNSAGVFSLSCQLNDLVNDGLFYPITVVSLDGESTLNITNNNTSYSISFTGISIHKLILSISVSSSGGETTTIYREIVFEGVAA